MQSRGPVKRKPKRQGPPTFQKAVVSRPGAITPRPRVKAYRPTPKQVQSARTQERAYRSQGKAVKRVAHVQAAQGVGRPTGGPTLVTRVEAAGKITRGRRRAREDKAIKKRLGFDPGERYGYTPKQTKHNVMPVPKGLEKAAKKGYLEVDQAKLKTAGFNPPGLAEAIVEAPKYGIKALPNIPRDVGELAIGTATSAAHVGHQLTKATVKSVKQGSPKPLVEAHKQIAKEAVEPYKELYKHPGEFFAAHPVTTAAMVLPLGRAGALGAGRVARSTTAAKVAKKTGLPVHQPERVPATLPGTSLRQKRRGSRDVIVRGVQMRQDRKQGAPRISTQPTMRNPVPELDRRVDEFADWAHQHKSAAEGSAAKKLMVEEGGGRGRVAGAPVRAAKRIKRGGQRVTARGEKRKRLAERRAERKAEVETKMSGAIAGGRQHTRREFAHEFGSTWERVHTPQGARTIKHAPHDKPEGSGVIHATREDADQVKKALERDKSIDWKPAVIEVKGETAGETAGWAVVPERAKVRLERHGRVGQAGFFGAPALRVSSKMFRKTVLPVSPKWLGGQVIEGAVRSMAHGGGPVPVIRYARGRRYLKAVERTTTQDAIKAGMSRADAEQAGKQAAARLKAQAVSSGQFSTTGPAAEYARHGGRTLEQEFTGTGSAIEPYTKALTELGTKPGARHARAAYRKYAEVVFNDINGPIERFYKTGMLGKEVKKQSPVLDRRLIGLSEKALDEAARGERGTAAQAELTRGTIRAYGKYSAHGPAARDTIMHATPFIPWFINMGNFLTRVMPADHPLKTSLVASVNQADQEWRKKQGLSFYGKNRKPNWLMGTYPLGKGKFLPAGRFGPFLPGEPVSAIGGQIYPQLQGPILAAVGVDWKGDPIRGGEGKKALHGALAAAEAQVPLVGVAGRLTGATDLLRGKKKPSIVTGEKKISQAALDVINPVKPIQTAPEKKKTTTKRSSGSKLGGRSSGSKLGGSSGGGKL